LVAALDFGEEIMSDDLDQVTDAQSSNTTASSRRPKRIFLAIVLLLLVGAAWVSGVLGQGGSGAGVGTALVVAVLALTGLFSSCTT
jgi:hypothetical protein